MADIKGIKVCFSGEIHIFRIANYLSESEYNKAWTSLTRKLAKENKPFTADPIYY